MTSDAHLCFPAAASHSAGDEQQEELPHPPNLPLYQLYYSAGTPGTFARTLFEQEPKWSSTKVFLTHLEQQTQRVSEDLFSWTQHVGKKSVPTKATDLFIIICFGIHSTQAYMYYMTDYLHQLILKTIKLNPFS